jgi:hypothetical protein
LCWSVSHISPLEISFKDYHVILVIICIRVISYDKLESLGVLMGSLKIFSLNCGYGALIFVYLVQSLSYMLWMRKGSMTFSLENESGFYMLKIPI